MPADLIPLIVSAAGTRRADMARTASMRIASELSRFDGWYSDPLVDELAGLLGMIADGATRNGALVSDAYLTSVMRQMGEIPVSGPDVVQGSARAGVTSSDAYARLASKYRYHLSTGVDKPRALDLIIKRADRMIATDVSLGAREQSRATMAANGIKLYRRVVRPEMSQGGTCGLCFVAADREYSTSDLLPIHGGCLCLTMPITDQDPGMSLNAEDLQSIYDAAGGSTKGPDLKRVRVQVDENGELGPVLSEAKHHTRTKEEVVKDSSQPTLEHARQSLAALEKALADSHAAAAAGEDRDAPIAYLTGRITKIKDKMSAGAYRNQ